MLKHISIDLGTSNTVISEKNSGVILNEPTLAAIDLKNNQLVAVGKQAFELLGKTPMDIRVISPVKCGVIGDFEIASAMLKAFIKSIFSKGAIRPKATICMPYDLTEVEVHTLTECAARANVKPAYTQEAPIAALMGAGIDVSAPDGNMIVDMGGGKICAAVVSFGGIVAATTDHCGGNKMDEAIIEYIKKRHGVLIGKKTAEEIKIKTAAEKSVSVLGRDDIGGLPKKITVTHEEILEALAPSFDKILNVIKKTLENTPQELICDILKNGICLCGGTAGLSGIDKIIEESIKFPTRLCEKPQECVSLGATLFDRG